MAVDVVGLGSGVVAVTAGDSHSCALLSTGSVKCWGDNFYSQLGSPALGLFPSLYPVDVVGLSGAIAIAAGSLHTCALTAGGGVKCWGNNFYGQLGTNTGQTATPSDVVGLTSGVAAIVAGYQHTCALTQAGALKCWGANYNGQIGNGSTANATTPVDVSGLGSGVLAVDAGGSHTCAVVTGGGAKCWGANGIGQLGNGTLTDALVPGDVSGLAGATAIALGAGHSCALTSGNVKCWGDSVANGTTSAALLPVDVAGISGATAIDAGGAHTCALFAGGALRCWGYNLWGQLGNAIPARIPNPVDVIGLSGIVAIANGEDHSCAITAASTVKCWGRNVYGALGNGTLDDTFTPVDVFGGLIVHALRAGGYSTCAITSAGGVKCWGELPTAGQAIPADVAGLASGVVDLAVGGSHACALTSAGAVKCWGFNGYGQLGDGTTTNSVTPVDVVGLASNVAALGIGRFHSCAIMSDGSVRCWGDNASGQLGVPPGGIASTPVIVTGLTDAALALDAGDVHTCVQTISFTMKCWGANYYAQFGIGHTFSTPGIVTVPLATGTLAMAAGGFHNCQSNGDTVRCWGINESGQIGNGTVTIHAAPVRSPTQVPGIIGASKVAAGGHHSCALVGGAVKCWGGNQFGQLGNSFGGYSLAPTPVLAGLCGGFSDVIAGNPFCANVAWSRNRQLMQGCAPGLLCAAAATTRLAMAGFVNRAGTALTQSILAAQDTPGAIDPAQFTVVCTTAPYPTGTQRRRVYVDGVLRALAGADTNIALRLVASRDGGDWYGPTDNSHGGVRAGRWSNHRLLADFDIPENHSVRFGIQVSFGLLPPASTLTDTSCNVRARIDNRNGPAPPF